MTWQVVLRPFPSANHVWLDGPCPVLVDTGLGADNEAIARANPRSPQGPRPSLVVNTHHHTDHVGGNHRMHALGVPIAMHALEADLVNARDADACDAGWLDQDIESFAVARRLVDGDTVETGASEWRVLHTPGHTAGHIALYCARERRLILGDLLHADDVGWLPPPAYRPGAIEAALDSVARVAALDADVAVSGHGPLIADVPGACAKAAARLRRWRDQPELCAWHAVKRIFGNALIVAGGLTMDDLHGHTVRTRWLTDLARALGHEPTAFMPLLVAEMIRAGAARWDGDRLVSCASYLGLPRDRPAEPTRPELWPPV